MSGNLIQWPFIDNMCLHVNNLLRSLLAVPPQEDKECTGHSRFIKQDNKGLQHQMFSVGQLMIELQALTQDLKKTTT